MRRNTETEKVKGGKRMTVWKDWNLDSVHASPFRYANGVVFPLLLPHISFAVIPPPSGQFPRNWPRADDELPSREERGTRARVRFLVVCIAHFFACGQSTVHSNVYDER